MEPEHFIELWNLLELYPDWISRAQILLKEFTLKGFVFSVNLNGLPDIIMKTERMSLFIWMLLPVYMAETA